MRNTSRPYSSIKTLVRVISHLSDFLQPLIILQEKLQIHKRNVHIWIATKLAVFLYSVFTTRESVFVDLKWHVKTPVTNILMLFKSLDPSVVRTNLILDLFRRVREEYGGVWVAGAHLGLSPLKRWKKRGVK